VKWKLTKPKIGDRRTVRKFAWLPVEIGDTKVWLETYETVEEVFEDEDRYGVYYLTWREVCHWDYVSRSWIYPERKLLHYHV
jgi:hypothetical protein